MNRWIYFLFLLCIVSCGPRLYPQGSAEKGSGVDSEQFFSDQTPLSISLKASVKSLKRDTNDSTYLEGNLRFSPEEGTSDSIDLRVRARGNFRKTQCYFAPLTLKFRKSDIEGTLFEGNKELKLVLPCQIGSSSDDLVLKEFLAYKLYEIFSPYHYQSRLVYMDFTEVKGKRDRQHDLLGILLEDHGTLAKRMDGKRVKRNMPPQMQDAEASIQNNMFQYAIGNTDFSIRRQHNQKLYYIQGKYLSIPYDFDMCGLVNAPYATVSNTQTLDCEPFDVTERCYKGYARDTALVQQVRRQFLEARPRAMQTLKSLEPYFKDDQQYKVAENYLESFFEILANDRKFEREILMGMRQ
jgi:hypothetical protein